MSLKMTTERRYVKHCSTDVLDRKRPASQFLGYRRGPQRVKTTRRTWSGQSPEQHMNLNAPSDKGALHNPSLKDQLQSLPPTNHEESAVVKKQRPSKRARERMRKKLERLHLEGEGQQETSLISSESGYETVWDHPPSASTTTSVPSPQRPPRGAMDSTDNDNHHITSTAVSAMEAYKARIHSRSDSASSANSLNTADNSLKKLLKDLHRCDVSIARYQAMLTEHCERGQQRLVQVFNSLRHDLNTREEDLIQELTTTQQTNGTVLQRRKDTASFLRQAAEKANTMEDIQVTELKQQIKQFVTDRKVDEEIGTMSRFQADPDDLLPRIMGFGKVLNVRPLYTSWEENPGEQIERSKDASCFPPISPLLTSPTNESASDKSGSQESICNKSDYDSAFVETLDEVPPESSTDCQQSCAIHGQEESGTDCQQSSAIYSQEESGTDCQQSCAIHGQEESNSAEESTSTHTIATHTALEMEGNRVEPTKAPVPTPTPETIHKDPLHTAALTNLPDKIGLAITKLPPLPHGSTPSQRSLWSTREKPHRIHPKFMKHKSVRLTAPSKPEQNPASLPAHDMSSSELLTGLPIITTSRSTRWREDRYGSHEKVEELPESELVSSCHDVTRSPEELVVIQSRVRDSLREQGVYLYDPFTGACPENLQEVKNRDSESAEFLPRKKKTPTQLRRERKKRQKERERRQQELERRGRDEVEVKEAPTIHEGSSNLNTVDMETCTGKSSNDSSSDSFNHPLQIESSTTSGEQRKKKKKKLSKGVKNDEMANEDRLTGSESYALSSDSEDGSGSSESQSSPPPPELAEEGKAVVDCAHIKGENGSQSRNHDQSIEENRMSPQTSIVHDADKSENDQQDLVSGTPNDGRNEATEEHREEPHTSLEPEEVQAEAYRSPGDCSTEPQAAGGRELQQDTDLTGATSESTMAASESTMTASESTMTANESTMAASESTMTASESTMTASESTMATSESNMAEKLGTADQESTNCSVTNEEVVAEQDLPSLANIPAETESAVSVEGIQPADLVSGTQEVRSENAALEGENFHEEKSEEIEASQEDASPCGMQLTVGTEAVDGHPSKVATLNSSSQELEIVETEEERMTVEVIAEEMESELPSVAKQASGGSPTSQASTDYEVAQPEIMDSTTDTGEAIRPENEDSNTDTEEAIRPENEDSNTDTEEATRPENEDSKTDTEEATRPENEDSKTNTEEATRPENEDSKTNTEEATRPENEDTKTAMNYSSGTTQPDNNGSDNEENSMSSQHSDMHGKGLEPHSTTQAKSPTTIDIGPKASEIETQTNYKPELESSDSDQTILSSITPETENQLNTHTDQDKLNSECFRPEIVPEPASMEAEFKQHEE